VFDPASHARYGHRLSLLSPSTPVLQREAEDDQEEIQMKADTSAPPLQREAEDEEMEADGEGEIQMKAVGAVQTRPNVPVASGGGHPLPASVRGKMERSFGHSFADVRIHSGGEAKQVGALAYTRGADIHFQPGLYDPLSLGGQELLGHELTHVIQQKAGRVSSPQNKASGAAPINADIGLEAEADALGARAARGESADVSGTSGGGLQLKADVVQCFRPPWAKAKSVGERLVEGADEYVGSPTSDVGGWAGGIGTTAQHFNDAPSAYGSPMDIGISDQIAGGLGFTGLLSAPSQVMGIGSGIKEMGKGIIGEKIDPTKDRVRDPKRVLEGAGNVGQNALGLVNTGASVVSGASTLAGAAGVAGIASGVAAPIAVLAGGAAMGKNGYQFGMAEYKRRQLGSLAKSQPGYVAPAKPSGVGGHLKSAFTPHGWGEKALDDDATKTDAQKAIEFAQSTQHKRRNRAGLNFAANSLVTAGGAAGVIGAATGLGAPIGAAVGGGLAGAGLGLKVGGFAARNLKQGGRNLAAWADSKAQPAATSGSRPSIGGSHANRFANVVNTVNDHMGPLSFNTEKSSAKKKTAVTQHTKTILNDPTVGKDILKGLGGNKADQARHDRYHELLSTHNAAVAAQQQAAQQAQQGGTNAAPTPPAPMVKSNELLELEHRLTKKITGQLKKRG
jgi:hypothetical protein